MDKRRSKQNYKIALYIRVSTEEQAENPEGSIKNQEERLRLHVKLKNADHHFGDIVEVFIDAGLSAKNMNRPAFQRMLTAVKAKQVDLLMVTELSRLSRSIKDFCEIKELLSEHGCDFKSLREDFDSSTASGEAMIFNFINMAQFERRQISERVSAGFLSRARRGLFNGGPVPVGYKPTGDKTGRLEIVPEEAATVQAAFKAFLEHRTLTEACKWLNENGYTLPKVMRNCGSRRSGYFLYDTLHTILRNKTYAGVKVFKVGKEKQETKGAWPPIIDEITFKRVQEILTKNNKGRKKSPRENRYPYILSGLVVCGKCGEKLCGKSANGEAGKIAYYDHSYSTKRQGTLAEKSFNCRPMRFLAKRLEPIVWQAVIDLLKTDSSAAVLIAKANEHHKGGDQKKERERLKDKIYGINGQLDALTERLSQLPKEVSATPIFKQMQKLELTKGELEVLVLKFDSALLAEDRPISIGEYNELLNVLRNDISCLIDEKSKVNLIERLIHKVEVFDTEVYVQFYIGAKKIKRELALASSLSLKNNKSYLMQSSVSSTSLQNGDSGTIRTCDPLLRREMLYPTELRNHSSLLCIIFLSDFVNSAFVRLRFLSLFSRFLYSESPFLRASYIEKRPLCHQF